jgi:leader peptidase (prepilin peptidase)/N-methyltransferase
VPRPQSLAARHRGALGTIVLATAVAVVLTLLRYGVTGVGLCWAAAQVVLGFIAAWDVLTRRILNVVVLPAAVVVVALRAAFVPSALAETLVAGGIAFVVFLVLVIALNGFGMGDVKLAGLLGLLLGRSALGALLAGCIAGGIAAAFLIASGRAGRKSTFAYGPYLVLGAALGILLGHPPPLV